MKSTITALLIAAAGISALAAENQAAESARVKLDRDDPSGRLRVLIDDKEALVYRYGTDAEVPYYYPLRSPSGKSMTVEHPNPYPHHRSFWFGDTVQLPGQRKVSFYSALYSKVDKNDPKSPFNDRVRHVEFLAAEGNDAAVVIRSKSIWEMDLGKTPLLEEDRTVRVIPLGDGEYLLDITFTVTAAYGDVDFVSDSVHYAWPYVRMNPAFSVQSGGTMTNSAGGVNQQQTHGKVAEWIDYSSTVDGRTEGLAIFSHPDNDHPHKWLTRDYGTFGPRRADAKSGKKFTLGKGKSMQMRVGILVHRGDVDSGKVARRYATYVQEK